MAGSWRSGRESASAVGVDRSHSAGGVQAGEEPAEAGASQMALLAARTSAPPSWGGPDDPPKGHRPVRAGCSEGNQATGAAGAYLTCA
eukprot:1181654-Prorocentrum_minimum.AAC.1